MWGPCTTDSIDSDRQIIDPEFAAKGLGAWLATGGNIREMHQPKAIGVGIGLERQGNQHWLKSRIVEPVACKLATEGVLRSYSVGISNAKIDYTKNPKARGGTIVGGDFVEVSLVDRPANADCKVDLVKAAATGAAEFTDILTKTADQEDEGKECPLCHGSGKIRDGHVTCPKCHGDGKLTEAEEADTTKGELSDKDRDQMDEDQFAYVDKDGGKHLPIHDEGHVHSALGRFGQQDFSGAADPEAAKKHAAKKILAAAKDKGIQVDPDSDVAQAAKKKKGDGKVPQPDKDVSAALDDAEQAVDEAQTAQAKDNEGWESGDTQADAKDGKYDPDDDSEKAEAPYTLKRLHDHLCPVYSQEAVAGHYPAAQKLRDALDVTYWSKAVTGALTEDNGTGKYTGMISMLSGAYGEAVQLAHHDDAVLDDAIAGLRKSFADMYPSVHVTPGQVLPGQFKRPFISTHRAGLKPSGHARIPLQANVPKPSDFDRSYLTGHEAANSPSAHGPNGASKGKKAEKRQFYSNNAKDQAAQAMTILHDYICAFHPDVCSMKGHDDTVDGGDGTLGVDTESRGQANGDSNRPTPAKPLNTGTKKALLLDDGTVDTAAVDKMISTKVAKATAKLEKRNKKLARKYQETSKELDNLRAQADPGAMAYRGGMIGPNVEKTVAVAEDPETTARTEQISWLKSEVRANKGTASRDALTKLQSLVSDDQLADLLTGA